MNLPCRTAISSHISLANRKKNDRCHLCFIGHSLFFPRLPIAGYHEIMSTDTSIATCANCTRTIGRLEQRYTWQQHTVCAECYERLSGAPASIPAAVPPVATPPVASA